MVDGSAPTERPAMDGQGCGALPLSEERMAYLAPRLQELLRDFRRLEALESAASEPATVFWPWGSGDDASG